MDAVLHCLFSISNPDPMDISSSSSGTGSDLSQGNGAHNAGGATQGISRPASQMSGNSGSDITMGTNEVDWAEIIANINGQIQRLIHDLDQLRDDLFHQVDPQAIISLNIYIANLERELSELYASLNEATSSLNAQYGSGEASGSSEVTCSDSSSESEQEESEQE
ncbi:hypothetical protein MRB53_040419 [Persea americana]|nr:hypothetical protein MRB53_040419 [Persea americana]